MALRPVTSNRPTRDGLRACALACVCVAVQAPARPGAQGRRRMRTSWTRFDGWTKVDQGDGMAAEQKGSMRHLMPETAAIVDELRQTLGTEWADRLVLGGKHGKGTFFARETGPDGVVREFGSRPRDGRRHVER